ncbi:hypothetical protein GCM10017687_49770 [Streptomyces echinatus]
MVEYATDLFDKETIEQLITRFKTVLRTVVATPDTPLRTLDVLLPHERHQLLETWNDTAMAATTTVSQVIEEQIRRTPDATALVFGEVELTYRQLDARADAIAGALAAHGVRPDSVVAVALPRSPELVATLLGVLKAGGVYLPIDPAYRRTDWSSCSPTRRRWSSSPTGPPSSTLPGQVWRCLLVEEITTARADPRPALRPEHLAYLIYTSGSTGVPKGVAMTSGALANLLSWHIDATDSGMGTRVAQFTALGFDVSVQEILSSLATGKSLIIPDDETRADPRAFAAWLRQQRISELFAPTPVLKAVCAAALEDGFDLPDLREVCQAGEALTLDAGLKEFFAIPGPGFETTMVRPKHTSSPAILCTTGMPTGRPSFPSALRSRTPACTCWIPVCVWFRSVSWVSCMCPGCSWRVAISGPRG